MICRVIGHADSRTEWRDFISLLDESGFRNIVIALFTTYGIYIVASLVYFDPWHMVTCFVQYLFMSPAYICILSIYAFANLHDLAW